LSSEPIKFGNSQCKQIGWLLTWAVCKYSSIAHCSKPDEHWIHNLSLQLNAVYY